MPKSLAELVPGESGRIAAIEGSAADLQRLRDMGVTRGTRVEVLRVAPLGDPLELRIRGFVLSVRRQEAKGILLDA